MKATLDQFKEYVRNQVDKQYSISPSMVVLKSFYYMEVEKPSNITTQTFEWLRSIAEQEIKNYKSHFKK